MDNPRLFGRDGGETLSVGFFITPACRGPRRVREKEEKTQRTPDGNESLNFPPRVEDARLSKKRGRVRPEGEGVEGSKEVHRAVPVDWFREEQEKPRKPHKMKKKRRRRILRRVSSLGGREGMTLQQRKRRDMCIDADRVSG